MAYERRKRFANPNPNRRGEFLNPNRGFRFPYLMIEEGTQILMSIG